MACIMYRLGIAEVILEGDKIMACRMNLMLGREHKAIARAVQTYRIQQQELLLQTELPLRVYTRPDRVLNELHYYEHVDVYGVIFCSKYGYKLQQRTAEMLAELLGNVQWNHG